MTDETKATVEYVVQRMAIMREPDLEDLVECWLTIATVHVPVGSKRKTVIREALRYSALKPSTDGKPTRLRALDGDSSEIYEPEAYTPPMEWKL